MLPLILKILSKKLRTPVQVIKKEMSKTEIKCSRELIQKEQSYLKPS